MGSPNGSPTNRERRAARVAFGAGVGNAVVTAFFREARATTQAFRVFFAGVAAHPRCGLVGFKMGWVPRLPGFSVWSACWFWVRGFGRPCAAGGWAPFVCRPGGRGCFFRKTRGWVFPVGSSAVGFPLRCVGGLRVFSLCVRRGAGGWVGAARWRGGGGRPHPRAPRGAQAAPGKRSSGKRGGRGGRFRPRCATGTQRKSADGASANGNRQSPAGAPLAHGR